jgi:protein-L-isoaspartate O-methyltransferase
LRALVHARRRERAAVDALGRITDRGDCDDPRGYPDATHEVRLIERRVRLEGRDVLEVGCGNGRLTFEYAARARRVVAIEPNRALVTAARRRARTLELRSVRFLARPAQSGIRGGPFDVVLFSWSL